MGTSLHVRVGDPSVGPVLSYNLSCPKAWDRLTPTANSGERHCSTCHVHARCVVHEPNDLKRKPNPPVAMGRMVR